MHQRYEDPSEQSLEQIARVIEGHEASGTLHRYLFSDVEVRGSDPTDCRGGPPSSSCGTPLHAFCLDRDGPRGEKKIALLLDAANRAGVPPRALASSLSDRSACDSPRGRPGGYTPLHRLVANDAATPGSVRALCRAWPGALFAGRSYGLTPLSDACYGCQLRSGDGLPSKVSVMIETAAEHTEEGSVGLVAHRDRIKGETPLHSLVQSLRWAAERQGRATRDDITKQLLRTCPFAIGIKDNNGNNPLHSAIYFGARFFSGREEYTLGMIVTLVRNTPREHLVKALSSENESSPVFKPSPEYSKSGREGGMTPVCLLRKYGMTCVEQYLRQESCEMDGRGWTMLHYAVADSSSGGNLHDEPMPTRDHSIDSDDRLGDGSCISNDEDDLLANKGGSKKLIDWLLTSAPQTSWIRDTSGRLPLHLATTSGLHWDEGVKSLVTTYPDSVSCIDRTVGLYPFMSAAVGPEADVSTIYKLLKRAPHVLAFHFGKDN